MRTLLLLPVLLLVLDLGLGAVVQKREAAGTDTDKKTEDTTAKERGKRSLRVKHVAKNCRVFVESTATDPKACSLISQDDSFEAGLHLAGVNKADLVGRCRWDPDLYKARGPKAACLCKVTEEDCGKDSEGKADNRCQWHKDPDTEYEECISQPERLYNVLTNMLFKRGKKKFAITLKYGATPARGALPLGPYGASIIGHGKYGARYGARKGYPGHPGHPGGYYGGYYGGYQGGYQYGHGGYGYPYGGGYGAGYGPGYGKAAGSYGYVKAPGAYGYDKPAGGYGAAPEPYGKYPGAYGGAPKVVEKYPGGYGGAPEAYGKYGGGYGGAPEAYGKYPGSYGGGYGAAPEPYGKFGGGYGGAPKSGY